MSSSSSVSSSVSSSEKRAREDDPSESLEITKKKKIVKIWTDGCFDMMHYGHANALRQVSFVFCLCSFFFFF